MASGGDIRYARCAGGIDIAYKVMGDGPIDVVFVPGFVSHLDLLDDVPFYCNPVDDMARFARVVIFDKRGTGLSDRSLGFGSLADRMDDIRAVMDAAGIERAALYGSSEGGPLAILFAATYPNRVTKLCLYGTFARASYDSDYQIGLPPEIVEVAVNSLSEEWGTGQGLNMVVQNIPPEAMPIIARYERNATTPKMVAEIMRSRENSTGTGTPRVCSRRRPNSSPATRRRRRQTGCSRRCCSPTSFRRPRRTFGSATTAGESCSTGTTTSRSGASPAIAVAS